SVYGSVRKYAEGTFVKGEERVPDMREDTFTALLNFKSGVTGTWTVINRPLADTFNTVMYYGSEGAINDPGDPFHGPRLTATLKRLDGTAYPLAELYEQYLAEMGNDERDRLFPYGLTNGFALETCDFLHSIRDQRPPEIDGEQGLHAKAIACAIYESAATNQVVRVQDVLDGKAATYQAPIDQHWHIA
ncbi:MAG: Gfo/Idh/MocA family oxidoreductase, partial [Chloroflexi bacterium]|nr:Gfo/Idh/MocA family oxidoreductase [Chloroflexota bacterium]